MIKGITHILKTDAMFQSIVGQNKALTKYKVYPVIAAQPEIVPFSVVRMTSREILHKGTSGANRNVFRASFAVRSYHNNYDELDELDDAVIQALVPFRGTANGINFSFIEYTGSSDDYIGEASLYERTSTFTVNYKAVDLT